MLLELVVVLIELSWKRLHLGRSTFSHQHHLKNSRASLQGLQGDSAMVTMDLSLQYYNYLQLGLGVLVLKYELFGLQ